MSIEAITNALEDAGTTIACGRLRDNPSRYALVITGEKELIQQLCAALTGDEWPQGAEE